MPSSEELVRAEKPVAHVMLIRIARPAKRNALTNAMVVAIAGFIDGAREDAECRCVVVDHTGLAIYVADIVYRSDAIKLHIDLLAGTRGIRESGGRQRRGNKTPDAKGGAPTTRVLRGCN